MISPYVDLGVFALVGAGLGLWATNALRSSDGDARRSRQDEFRSMAMLLLAGAVPTAVRGFVSEGRWEYAGLGYLGGVGFGLIAGFCFRRGEQPVTRVMGAPLPPPARPEGLTAIELAAVTSSTDMRRAWPMDDPGLGLRIEEGLDEIASVLSRVAAAEQPFLMDVLRGVPLAEASAKHRLPLGRAAEILRRALEGVG
ncbi:MAG: hypothetical protein HRU70_03000 [Phycisphaeraceae bacterium]|nr:MAG: hypothetical protein HRU70_03000 [Phycisphaeraceae bacterium]